MREWLNRTTQKVRRFMGKVAGGARAGMTFLNGTLLPGAKRLQGAVISASQEIAKDPNISEKNRERLKTLNKLSDVGIQKLTETTDTLNRVRAVI